MIVRKLGWAGGQFLGITKETLLFWSLEWHLLPSPVGPLGAADILPIQELGGLGCWAPGKAESRPSRPKETFQGKVAQQQQLRAGDKELVQGMWHQEHPGSKRKGIGGHLLLLPGAEPLQ